MNAMCCRLDAVVAAVRESTRRVRELRRRRSRRWRLRETTYHTDDELLAKLKGVLPARATHLVAQAAPCVEIIAESFVTRWRQWGA